jgi:hypothetical protein
MTESVGNETIEKYWFFFCLVVGTDRMFSAWHDINRILGYVDNIYYAITKINL